MSEIIDLSDEIYECSKIKEKQAEEEKKEFFYLNKIGEKFSSKAMQIRYIKPNLDNIDIYKYVYECNKIYITKKDRKIISHIYKWDIHQEVECITKTLCTSSNIQFEVNPASTFNLSAYDKNNNLLCKLNTYRILNEDPEDNDIKKQLNEKYHYPQELLDIMKVVRGKLTDEYFLVISPTEFVGMAQFMFGAAPCCVGKHTSLYSLTLMVSEILSLFTTKSKLADFYKMQHGDCATNRQQFILNFNGFAKYFDRLELLQRKIMLKYSNSLLVDETFISCR